MPATTAVSAIPAGRPGFDVQIGVVPGFYASQTAQHEAQGAGVAQAALTIEPDRWIKLPGLVIGGRTFGQSGDTLAEPYVGYRTKVNDAVSFGGGAYGTATRAKKQLASYHATRIGGEVGVDANAGDLASWLQLHVAASVSATRILTSGSYCADRMGIAIDCDEEPGAMNTVINGKQTGIYPAATGMVTLASLHDSGSFRSAQISLVGSVGQMPLVQNGEKTGNGTYESFGLTLSLGIGE